VGAARRCRSAGLGWEILNAVECNGWILTPVAGVTAMSCEWRSAQ
jgi:hypothetical protein